MLLSDFNTYLAHLDIYLFSKIQSDQTMNKKVIEALAKGM